VIHAFVKETTAGFRLPDDPWRPIIMIGRVPGSRRSAGSCASARR
jgi:sulfite reductase alpha subunit-like flavoprotein